MILKASVLIVLLCLIFGICFRYRYRLAEPVFVQQNTAVTAIFDDSEAKPGDLIFFKGTYNAGETVTHIGIYVGNNRMLHCGNPIQYTSIDTNYWRNHFYAYGRL